ncbi:MAG: Long-chain-fatty-acid--CoA ligase FadD13 [Firmicutes bacterium ADurb.Bin300]|nr:MAG: Long-chain-fatty-acid--CoA ligase FadD13 [Firmicutes bacterium ADurb.Bin300]
MPITDFLENNAKLYKDDVSLVEINPQLPEKNLVTWKEFSLIETSSRNGRRSELTWGEFDKKANRFANLLLSRGIKKGDRVAILLLNCIEWLPIYFGILKTGALAVPLNYRYTSEEIQYCLKLSECCSLVFGPEFIGRIEEIYGRIPSVKLLLYAGEECPTFAESYDRLVTYCSSKSPCISLSDEDDAAIYFSSGTTGFPKAILHIHKSLVHACKTEQEHHMQTKEDIFLCIPPLYHTGAKMHWFGNLICGGKAVILKGNKPEWTLKAISEEKCTIVWLLVPWAQDILDSIARGDIDINDYRLSQWRLMHIGAQPVPQSLIKRWHTYFPNHKYDTNYGLSESTGPGCVHLGIDNIDKVGSIGKAGFGWKTKIVDEKRKCVKRGEVGELAVKGPAVMKCYYNDEKATNEVLSDGWLFTGDMAMEDEDGFIYLVDRKKDVIITGGENIYPVQIEDFLRRNDAVKDCAVIGLPDKRLGEIAAAIIELKKGYSLSEEQINEFCLELPRYKRPRVVIFADVPRNPTGKIEKPKLRKMYCGDSLVAKQVLN